MICIHPLITATTLVYLLTYFNSLFSRIYGVSLHRKVNHLGFNEVRDVWVTDNHASTSSLNLLQSNHAVKAL